MYKLMNKGVTLLEVLVSVSIFAIITAVVMYNHAAFDANVLVTNLSYEVALTIKQAQSYGLSVRKEPGFSGNYGVYFSIDPDKNKQIVIFADSTSDNFYDNTQTADCIDECREVFELRGDVSITHLDDESAGERSEMIILFKRPDPIAHIYGDIIPNAPEQNYGEITIESGRGKIKRIKVERSGQISVQ